MGGCSSKQQSKKTKVSTLNSKPNQLNSSHNGNQPSQETLKKYQDEHKNNLNQVALHWKTNTIGIWKRSYDKLAIHTDIPRLGHKIEIVDKLDRLGNIQFSNVTTISLGQNGGGGNNNINGGGESPLYIQNGASNLIDTNNSSNNNNMDSNNAATLDGNSKEENGSAIPRSDILVDNNSKFTSSTTLTSNGFSTSQVLKKEEVIYQVLTSLAYLLDGKDKEKQIKSTFSNYIKGSGDMSQQLLLMLGAEVGETSRLMSLLKVCHQKIILPAYYFIKANLFEELPFRDKRGSWRMKIVLETDGTVIATHSKRQQSTAGSENDPEFEFEWSLSIIFDKDMNINRLKVEIVDLIISKNISNDKRQEIQKAFSVLQSATNTTNSSTNNSEPIPLNKVDF
ncbi:hypothetical protein CYY_005548 [Polysphondylium violaceum]|uniref:Ras guanine nucleotide exchange factor glfB-like C-terminal domain-containing protein n=1 Tax=Polysphondylium violaceum TaxID=133409 RepID=A0A8J4PTB8_9MYCE|nr:hypothetical protein CYY_005548 [Polysphondylium violaceum]